MNDNVLQRWKVLFPFAILMATAYLLYMQMFSGVWLMDDLPVIVNNPDIRSFNNFFENYYPGRPLRELTYLVDYSLFGLKPSGYYVQNIFWHGLCSVLLFLLAKQLQLPSPVAWFAALVFLLHPVQVEVVANNSHRKDSLALAFCLLSFYFYLRGRTRVHDGGWLWLLTAFLSWALALTAKQNAFVLPLVVAAYELRRLPSHYLRPAFLASIAIMATGLLARVVYLVNDQDFLKSVGPALAKLDSVHYQSGEIYYLTVMKAWAFMMSKLIFPLGLSMEYTFKVPTQWSDAWVLCGFALAVLFLVGFFWASQRSTVLCLALAWFLAFWLPTSNLLGHLSYFAADRYLYSPMVGLSLLAACGLWWLSRENLRLFAVVALLLLSPFVWKTWSQQALWCDADKFYENMHEVSPQALEGLFGLGSLALERGDYQEATSYLQKALRRDPGDARIPYNLGYIASLQGDFDQAVYYFKSALSIKPNMVDSYNNLGSVYDALGQPQRAIEVLEKALAINSHFEKAYTNLGVVYERMGDLEKAESLHRRALKELPSYGQAYYNLGNTLYYAGRKQEALASYQSATRFAPEHEDALYNYATVASELGHQDVIPHILARLRALNPQLTMQLKKELRQ